MGMGWEGVKGWGWGGRGLKGGDGEGVKGWGWGGG